MRKSLTFGGMIALCLVASGCGSSGPDALINEMIACMNDMADAIEKKAPKDKIDALKARGDELDKKLKALNLSKEDEAKLREKHKDALEKAGKRMMEAMMKDMGGLIPGMPSMPGLPKSGN